MEASIEDCKRRDAGLPADFDGVLIGESIEKERTFVIGDGVIEPQGLSVLVGA